MRNIKRPLHPTLNINTSQFHFIYRNKIAPSVYVLIYFTILLLFIDLYVTDKDPKICSIVYFLNVCGSYNIMYDSFFQKSALMIVLKITNKYKYCVNRNPINLAMGCVLCEIYSIFCIYLHKIIALSSILPFFVVLSSCLFTRFLFIG